MTRMIFTLSPGRCGTEWLARMLDTRPGIIARHEPPPRFSEVMRKIQTRPGVAWKWWIDQKLPAIERMNAPVYVETSHLFSQGFVEPLLTIGVQPEAIVITREHRDVALSYWRRRSIPGRTPNGLYYLLCPSDPVNVPLPEWRKLTDYQLCYWFCLEIADRVAVYKELLQPHVYETTFEDMINDIDGLLDDMALPPVPQGVVIGKVNAGSPNGYPPGDLAEQEQEVMSLCGKSH